MNNKLFCVIQSGMPEGSKDFSTRPVEKFLLNIAFNGPSAFVNSIRSMNSYGTNDWPLKIRIENRRYFFCIFWCDKAALLFYKRKVSGCHMSQELSRLSNLIIEFANFQLKLNNFKTTCNLIWRQ